MPTIASLVTSKILRLGSAGPDVSELQKALAKLGYPLNPKGTGYFGTVTSTAVEQFQRNAGIDPTGDVSTSTARAIDAALAAPRPATNAAPSVERIEVGRPLWLQESIAHIGLREQVGAGSNRELLEDIQTVAADYQDDATPWCAGWVSFCLVKGGAKPSKQPLWARSYAEDWGVELDGPAVGAIAVKTRKGGGHVTFIAGKTRKGLLACCGGNQNDMVNVSAYAPESFNLGFWWPKEVPLPRVGMDVLPIVNADGRVLSEA